MSLILWPMHPGLYTVWCLFPRLDQVTFHVAFLSVMLEAVFSGLSRFSPLTNC